ncbi:hypothetical protein [Kiloniella laminariae]|uniref:hypothetical protein n=1 Tax=Kiloniella laminariae TaxID=454162 RepID=UPI0012F76FFB|nr:hypothetical protein [Kiloniella laminariae]
MVVNDQPVHMERVITCETVALGNAGLETLFKRAYTEYRPYPLAFGERLPDQSAVMMWTPYECDREEFLDTEGKTQIRARQNAPDYVPRIGWTPSYSPIETLEYYIDRKSFTHPNRRIKNIKIHSELLSDSGFPFYKPIEKPSKPDDFVWFTGIKPPNKHKKVLFVAFYAQVLTEKKWRGYNTLIDAELDSYNSPQRVAHRPELNQNSPIYLIDKMFRDLGYSRELATGYGGHGVSSQSLNKNTPVLGFGVDLSEQDLIVQLLPEDGVITVSNNNTWDRLVFRKEPDGQKRNDSSWMKYSDKDFLVNGQLIKPNKFNTSTYFLFDPESQDLFSVKRSLFQVYPERDNPLFQSANEGQ